MVGGFCKVELGESFSLPSIVLLEVFCVTVASPREYCSQCHSREDTEAPGGQAAGPGCRLEGQSGQSLKRGTRPCPEREAPEPSVSYPESPTCGPHFALPLWFSLGALDRGRRALCPNYVGLSPGPLPVEWPACRRPTEAQRGHRPQHPISASPTNACCCSMRTSAPPGGVPGPTEGWLWVGCQGMLWAGGSVYLPRQ